MRVFIQILLLFIVFKIPAFAQGNLKQKCEEFNRLNTLIRDGEIGKTQAKSRFSKLIKEIELELGKLSFTFKDSAVYFPIKGYSSSAIGGINGNGYLPGKYVYFDGNLHTGHPAQDIFIRDFNQDSKDEINKKEVPVVSISAGVVVACEADWEINSNLRGGKYIWVFDPIHRYLIYYAHQNKILVQPGDWVKAGQEIGRLGRTGKNAFQKRSPTHLHVMILAIDNQNLPKPINAFPILKMGRLQNWF